MLPAEIGLTIARFGDGGHMNWGDGWWIVMAVGMVLFWGLVIFGLIWVFASSRDRNRDPKPEDPLAILDRRLAEGLISPDEYGERKNLLDARHARQEESN